MRTSKMILASIILAIAGFELCYGIALSIIYNPTVMVPLLVIGYLSFCIFMILKTKYD